MTHDSAEERRSQLDQPLPPPPPEDPLAKGGSTAFGHSGGQQGDDDIDRGTVISAGVRSVGRWAWSLIGIMLATAAIFWLLAKLQVGLIPIMLAIIVCTVLYPLKQGLERIRFPSGLASAVVLLAFVAIVGGLFASVAPGIVQQISAVVSAASRGLQQLERWLAGPPLNIDNEQLQQMTSQATNWLQGQASSIASGVFTGVSTVGSVLITIILVLMLTFFFLKDGDRFLPAVRLLAGRRAGQHLSEVLARIWSTLGAFIRTQAVVGAIDAIGIGLGLVFLQVPLAFALAIITFLFSFIPTVGAFVAGALAVLVALVSNSFTTAMWVLVLVIAVQQIESNLVFPLLQRRSINVHPAISLVSVAIGGTTFGLIGAFLAVPVVATALVVLRYLSEQIDVVSGERDPSTIRVVTPDGALAAAATAQLTKLFRRSPAPAEDEVPDARAESPILQPMIPRPRLNQLRRLLRRPEPAAPDKSHSDKKQPDKKPDTEEP
ncbi:AI-2E family transporter [Granulicoccus sp. GXG6511]|uniref:AI-2E family transporter n=1 Tax=Granulicoccus sp. GXG6511 TaxID=3381351 RepID=UPI003D7C9FC4